MFRSGNERKLWRRNQQSTRRKTQNVLFGAMQTNCDMWERIFSCDKCHGSVSKEEAWGLTVHFQCDELEYIWEHIRGGGNYKKKKLEEFFNRGSVVELLEGMRWKGFASSRGFSRSTSNLCSRAPWLQKLIPWEGFQQCVHGGICFCNICKRRLFWGTISENHCLPI